MKKLTVNSLAANSIKHRKRQYILLSVGVILAMLFSSAAVFFVSSFNASKNELIERCYGRQTSLVYGTDRDKMIELSQSGNFLNMGISEELGFIFNEGAENKGSYIAKFDEQATKYYIDVEEGRLPEKEGEIALEKDTYARLRLKIAIGESFTVRLTPLVGTELSEKSTEKTYTLVGLLADKRSYYEKTYYRIDYFPSAIVSSCEQIEDGGRPEYGFYFDTPISFKDESEQTEWFIGLYGKESTSSDFISPILKKEAVSLSGIAGYSDMELFNSLGITLCLVMALVSAVGIINAFNGNLTQRKKQIGMYRAVGATRRQIIAIFGREALFIALFCTPVSVLLAFFAVKTIIGRMDNLIFIPKFGALFSAAGVSMLTVFAAALIPLFRVSKTPPMLAIRNTDYNRKLSKMRIKTVHSYKPQSLLAKRSMRFSRGRSVAVCIILALSVFIGNMGFAYVSASNREHEYNYDYEVYSYFITEADFINILGANVLGSSFAAEAIAIPHVSEIRSYDTQSKVNVLLQNPTAAENLKIFSSKGGYFEDEAEIAEMTAENFEKVISSQPYRDDFDRVAEHFNYPETVMSCSLSANYPDEIEKAGQNLASGSIDIEKINSGEEIILVVPREQRIQTVTNRSGNTWLNIDSVDLPTQVYGPGYKVTDIATVKNETEAGDELTLSFLSWNISEDDELDLENVGEVRKNVKIGAVVYSGENLDIPEWSIVTTAAGYTAITGQKQQPNSFYLRLDTENNDEIDASVTDELQILSSGADSYIASVYANNKSTARNSAAFRTALISILMLLFVTAVSLINNSFTARIRDGKRQIGTLRSVGASVGDLTAIYIREFLRILLIGTAVGFVLYNIAYATIYAFLIRYVATNEMFSYRLVPALIFCLAVFILCTINLFIQVKRQMKSSIVDNIREL